MDSNFKPLLYLDVDDTLLRFPRLDDEFWKTHPRGGAADGAGEFFRWLKRHFEVRWLTMWCPSGTMDPGRAIELASMLGVTEEEVAEVRNPHAFMRFFGHRDLKTDALDWAEIDDGRPWVWIEDALLDDERLLLTWRNLLNHWIPCNVSANPNRLIEVKEILQERFHLDD